MRRITWALGACLLAASALGTAPSEAEPDPSASTSPAAPSASPEPTPSVTPSPSPSPSPSASPSLSPSPSPSASAADDPAPLGTQNYIVVAEDGVDPDVIKQRAIALGGQVDRTLEGAINAITAALTPRQFAELAADGRVDYIEIDEPVSITSTAIRTNAGCSATSLPLGDDVFSAAVDLGFTVNWFGREYTGAYVNNNGGISLNDGLGAFSSYTGVDLDSTTRPLILPLFTDIDTRNSSAVTYGQITDLDGNGDVDAWCANWVNVGEYNQQAAKFSFQLVIIDQGNGDVDLEFNYAQVSTPTSGSNGTFVAGYAVPTDRNQSLVRIRSTDATGPYVDGGSAALITNKYPSSSSVAGRYTYEIRPGTSPTPTPTPTPSTPSSSCSSEQTNAPWGLDRIDQRALPLDTKFACAGSGSGIRAYIVDTGIAAHDDYTGRLDTATGYTAISDGNGTSDCNGHGTHVAGTVGGTRYGVAKGVTLIPIRVLSCSGSGTSSGVIAGLNHIQALHTTGAYAGVKAVANMSLGGGASKALDDAVAALVAAGVTVVVAAGNSNDDASLYSPARETTAITVGATDSSDNRASFSNYGSVVDVFAPGVAITSTYIGSSTATRSLSGTSMAAPHVAGAVAMYLGTNPTASPATVATQITSNATENVVQNPGSGSPNLLLYTRNFTPTPTVASLSPVNGSTAGGTSVTITGTNFTGATAVTFGGTNASAFTVNSNTSITATTPAKSAGAVDVAVTTAQGTGTLSNGFTYTDSSGCSLPTITSLGTTSGSQSGGTSVVITGSNFTNVAAVTFDGTPASYTVNSATQITSTSPSGRSSGSVNVLVITNCGATATPASFTYIAVPSISSVSPAAGPTSGGTTVAITGVNFSSGATVTFGGSAAASVTVNSSSSITAVSPARSAGTVDVSVTTGGGTATKLEAFSFLSAPIITSVSQSSGPATGGTVVYLNGSGFSSVSAVGFGSTSASYFTLSTTLLLVFAPAGTAGVVDISVTTPGGTDSFTNGFTYTAVSSGGSGSSGGGGTSGGGSSSAPAGGGGGGLADDEISVTEDPVTTNQVSRAGAFQVVDASGNPVQLREAGLTATGFTIAGPNWEVQGSGALTAAKTTVRPGELITIEGSGLQRLTTTGVYILSSPTWVGAGVVSYENEFSTTFMMPALPLGQHTIQINMVRQGQLPVSVAIGFTLAEGSVPSAAKAPAASSLDSAQIITFAAGKSSLSANARKKLDRVIAGARTGTISLTAFGDTQGSASSVALATKRGDAIRSYITNKGLNASIDVTVSDAPTKTQSRSVLIRLSPAQFGAASVSDQVTSLIVQYKVGVKPMVGRTPPGVELVPTSVRSTLSVGASLGFRMWRIDFASPVSEAEAKITAQQMTRSKNVVFAEPDSIVTTQVSAL